MACQSGVGTVTKYGQKLRPCVGTWVSLLCPEGGLHRLPKNAKAPFHCSEFVQCRWGWDLGLGKAGVGMGDGVSVGRAGVPAEH